MADLKKIGELLVIIGGIVGLILGITQALDLGTFGIGLWGIGVLGGLVEGIILIILSLIVLVTSGVLNIPALKFDNNWLVLLIFGILMLLFSGGIGALLVIIGAILYVVK
ncbi:MAG: hypothetical protein ACFFER_14400 [Candidatus Thorarchaeota archaeon]